MMAMLVNDYRIYCEASGPLCPITVRVMAVAHNTGERAAVMQQAIHGLATHSSETIYPLWYLAVDRITRCCRGSGKRSLRRRQPP